MPTNPYQPPGTEKSRAVGNGPRLNWKRTILAVSATTLAWIIVASVVFAIRPSWLETVVWNLVLKIGSPITIIGAMYWAMMPKG
jgi:hypothetical protein